MNIITFTYTKKDGSISNRVLAPSVVPNTMYEGIDISELDMEEQAALSEELDMVHGAYLAAMKELQDKYDVNHRYRRFDPKLMSNVVVETI